MTTRSSSVFSPRTNILYALASLANALPMSPYPTIPKAAPLNSVIGYCVQSPSFFCLIRRGRSFTKYEHAIMQEHSSSAIMKENPDC